MTTEIATMRKLSEIVAEYDEKIAAAADAITTYNHACDALKMASTIGGTFGHHIDTKGIYESDIQRSLLKSAWQHVYKGLQIDRISSAKDRDRFRQAVEKPAPFTLENIRATFGPFIQDPRGNILRGLAEVFGDLDPFYKSHEKMKVGVKGLPKRVILGGFGGYSSWGQERVRDILNALASYQGKPMVEWAELNEIAKDVDALKETRGVWLEKFKNGNGHLYFSPATLRDINLALAEYYGEVVPDMASEKPSAPVISTAVSKDLQYYPTPREVVQKIVDDLYIQNCDKILEPSCGCGRFMDALRVKGANVFGIEFDPMRTTEAERNGHAVLRANFLEVAPQPIYDRVVMNPPFYGKHYAKHVEHALKFLKPGGTLTAILPITARHDHGLLDHHRPRWSDLPTGSFSESGTNINTTVATIFKKEIA